VDAKGNRIEVVHNIASREEIITDTRGNTTKYLYDDRGNVLGQERSVTIEGVTVLVVSTFEYDDLDNITRSTNPDGIVVENVYNASGDLLQTALDPGALNLVTEFTYNARGQVLTQTDAAGNVMTFEYDSAGSTTQIVDALGNASLSEYNSRGLPIRNEDPLGNVTTKSYDSAGNLIEEDIFDASGNLVRKREVSYDANGNRLSETLYRTINGTLQSITTTFEYDKMNRLVKTIDPLGGVSQIEYNDVGKESAHIDALGRRTAFEHDETGNLIRKTFPDSTFETIEYDEAGYVIKKTDRAGRTTTLDYDELNRLVKTTFADGSTSSTVYSPDGRELAQIDGKGNRTDYEYDTNGRLAKTIQPEVFDGAKGIRVRPETVQEYDAAGNRTAVIDANGNRTEFVFNNVGLLIKTVFPDSSFKERHYDARSRLIKETDEKGRSTTYGYDTLGRMVSVTLPPPFPGADPPVTTYTYDEADNKLTQTDALQHTVSFSYDELNRQVKRVLPGGETETHSYEAVSNVLTHTDFNGDTTAIEYDSMNQVTKKTFADGTTVEFAYTPTGQRKTVVDSRGTTSYLYDPVDRLLSISHPRGEKVEYTYDSNGNRLTVKSPSVTVEYEYDALGRLIGVTDSIGKSSYTYDAAGNRKSVVASNGVVTEYNYDTRNRLTGLVHRTGAGTTLGSYTYPLSPTGQRTQVTEADGSVVDYTYDNHDRLTSEVRTGSGAYDISYEYDAVGNRTRMVKDGVETLYKYNINDFLLTAGASTYAYDSNGRMISKTDGGSTTTYAYDFENRLTGITDATGTTTFTYDVDGNRVGNTGASGEVISYLVDMENNTGFAQVLEERNGTGTLLAQYTYGDDLLSMNRGETTSFYSYDGQMATRLLTDVTGSVTDTYTYDAFGNLMDATGSTINFYQYTGEQYDPNLGFYYLRARYYDPQVGRFLSMDPFGGIDHDPVSLHKYLYANANLVNAIDPSGELTLVELNMAGITRSILRARSAVRTVGKYCRLKTLAENFAFAFGIIQATTSVAFDLNNILNNTGGYQTPGTIYKYEFFHPLAKIPLASKVVSKSAVKSAEFKLTITQPKKDWVVELKVNQFSGTFVSVEFIPYPWHKFLGSVKLSGGKSIAKLSMKSCGTFEVMSFSLNFAASKKIYYSKLQEAKLFLKVDAISLFEMQYTLVEHKNGVLRWNP
jgi:RHS repeat-associated protein